MYLKNDLQFIKTMSMIDLFRLNMLYETIQIPVIPTYTIN